MTHGQHIVDFVTAVTTAMGLSLTATVVETPDGMRVDLEGEGGEVLTRRRGEALNALQQIVASVFRDELPEGQRIAVDCLGFRQGKDAELRQMASSWRRRPCRPARRRKSGRSTPTSGASCTWR